MGCSQSKIENEEAVSRCKDRKVFMKSAVTARNAFAAAHCSYAMSLKNAGAALSDFAQGEVVNPLSLSSAPVGPTSAGVGPTMGAIPSQAPPPPPPVQDLPPPPPPIPGMPQPLQRAVSMPEFAVKAPGAKLVAEDTIEEEDEEEEDEEQEEEEEEVGRLRRRRDNKGGSVGGRMETTPSISNLGTANTNIVGPPPSPPPPDERAIRTPPPPPLPEVHKQTWDYFFNTEDIPGGSLRDDDDIRGEYDRTVYHQRAMRSSASSASITTALPPSIEMVEEMVMPEKPPMGGGGRVMKKGKQVVGQGGSGGEGRRKTVNVNLVQIFSDLDDCFLKASESAHHVSKMLEATRLHYHSNFADNRGN